MSSFAVHWGHVGMFGVKACSLPRRRTVTQGHAGYTTEHLWVRSVARDFVILYVDVSLRQALIESFLGMSKVHIYLAVPFLFLPSQLPVCSCPWSLCVRQYEEEAFIYRCWVKKWYSSSNCSWITKAITAIKTRYSASDTSDNWGNVKET